MAVKLLLIINYNSYLFLAIEWPSMAFGNHPMAIHYSATLFDIHVGSNCLIFPFSCVDETKNVAINCYYGNLMAITLPGMPTHRPLNGN